MNVKSAWDANYTGKGILVAVVDDGVKIDHPDLRSSMVSYDNNGSNSGALALSQRSTIGKKMW